ncbi:hypothetical protein SAMN05421858_3056 [Haladaptatus litoreus]|uniref:Uncharacterized protein n=1 Tax=Haladaptatus litoreus TaxID=553468 RepID=A0A1N7CK02_9EURY|nr:hypothetical protein SAMN05421858_3056 [Haladaptatus litoreus]
MKQIWEMKLTTSGPSWITHTGFSMRMRGQPERLDDTVKTGFFSPVTAEVDSIRSLIFGPNIAHSIIDPRDNDT